MYQANSNTEMKEKTDGQTHRSALNPRRIEYLYPHNVIELCALI